jgi:hypothetical protein
VDHTRGDRREVERDDALDQSPLGQLTIVVKRLAARLDKSDALDPHEVAELRELMPQVREMLESRRRSQWLWKRIGAAVFGGPAILALWQAGAKLIEWIRSQ